MTNRIHRWLAVAAVVLGAGAFGGEARAQAYGGGVPYHSSGGAYCSVESGSRTIRAYPPRAMTTAQSSTNPLYLENIYWRADLYHHTATGWKPYDETKPWLAAVANTSAIRDWWRIYPTGATYLNWLTFSNLPRGSYAVYETYLWQTGLKWSEYSTFSRNNWSSQICTFNV